MSKKVSIIIRTKNEERWIGLCLEAVYSQDYADFEVILVDNQSTDKTVEKASRWPVRVITIDQFFPGRAINTGISASDGEYLVCLSGHCIPKDIAWLRNLVTPLEDEAIGGVYGRQEPLSLTSELDRRDLYITFGQDNRDQVLDSFFHNANSAFRRTTWEQFPFDDHVSNIEDRLWGREILTVGKLIRYQANASVYHHHGIHQEAQVERAQRIVRIMESMDGEPDSLANVSNGSYHNIAMIATRENHTPRIKRRMLEKTIQQLSSAKHIRKVVLATSDPEAMQIGESCGCFIYDRSNSGNRPEQGIQEVYKNSLLAYEDCYGIPDTVTLASELYPFRGEDTFSILYKVFMETGAEVIVCGLEEKRTSFIVDRRSGQEHFINRRLMPRESVQDELAICSTGLGCIASPSRVREEMILSSKFLVLPRTDTDEFIEVQGEEVLETKRRVIDSLLG